VSPFHAKCARVRGCDCRPHRRLAGKNLTRHRAPAARQLIGGVADGGGKGLHDRALVHRMPSEQALELGSGGLAGRGTRVGERGASRASSFDLLSVGGGGAGFDDANVLCPLYECVVHKLSDCSRTMGGKRVNILVDRLCRFFEQRSYSLTSRFPFLFLPSAAAHSRHRSPQKSFFLAARLLRRPISWHLEIFLVWKHHFSLPFAFVTRSSPYGGAMYRW
jgi:hypothetical protein